MGLTVLRTAVSSMIRERETLGRFGHEPSFGGFNVPKRTGLAGDGTLRFRPAHAFEQRAAAQARIQPKRGIDGYFGKTLRLDAAAAPRGFQTAWRAAKYAEKRRTSAKYQECI